MKSLTTQKLSFNFCTDWVKLNTFISHLFIRWRGGHIHLFCWYWMFYFSFERLCSSDKNLISKGTFGDSVTVDLAIGLVHFCWCNLPLILEWIMSEERRNKYKKIIDFGTIVLFKFIFYWFDHFYQFIEKYSLKNHNFYK